MTNLLCCLFVLCLPLLTWGVTPISQNKASDHQPPSWIYFFHINGDLDYLGPSAAAGVDQKIELVDQSQRIYQQALDLASHDYQNSYAIFFDPRGRTLRDDSDEGTVYDTHSPGPQSATWTVFYKGKRIFFHHTDEVDATSPRQIRFLAQKAWPLLKKSSSNFRLVYYFYGEHFPSQGGMFYDLSHPQSRYGQRQFLDGLQAITSKFGRLNLLILQSCYLNHPQFLGPIQRLTENVFLPELAILNRPLHLQSLVGPSTSSERVEALLSENQTDPLRPLIYYNSTELRWIKRLYDLQVQLDQKEFIPVRETLTQADSPALRELDPEARHLLTTQEAIVDIYSYLNLIYSYTTVPTQLDEIIDEMEQQPNLEKLRGLIQPLPDQGK